MSRVIIVLTTGRSGSSAVAGALHNLDVHMSDREHTAGFGHKNHRGGHWEDLRWHRLGLEIVDGGHPYRPTVAQMQTYQSLVEERSTKRIWGVKTPTFSFLLLPLLQDGLFGPDVRVVCVHRTFVSAARSRQEKDRPRQSIRLTEDAQAKVTISQLQAVRYCHRNGIPVHHISFEHLIDDPDLHVNRMRKFAYASLPADLNCPDPDSAIRFIRKDYVKY